jgi:hypothetical protein
MQQPGSRTTMKNICALQAQLKKSFKMYIVPEGGHLNVGSKVSNTILTYVHADLFYWAFK